MNKQGKLINPHNILQGAFIPNWILRRKEISNDSKIIYAEMFKDTSPEGIYLVNIKKLSESTGLDFIFVKKHIKELLDNKLIRCKEASEERVLFSFLSHDWINE